MPKKKKKLMTRFKGIFFIIFIVSVALLIFNGIIEFFKIWELPYSEARLYVLSISLMASVFWWGLLWTLEKL